MDTLERGYEDSLTISVQRNILRNAYIWMSLALAVTAAVAYCLMFVYPAAIEGLLKMGSWALFGVGVVQIGIVLFISAQIKNLSSPAAIGFFLLYAGVMGLTVAFYGYVFGLNTMFKAFAVTALMFAGSSLFGFVTKSNLSSIGHFAGMALWGLMAALIINFFMKSPVVDYVISLIGVVLFTLLTAYDTQKIKNLSQDLSGKVNATDYIRYSILGALTLYLDFINLLLFLTRIFGGSRN